MHNSKLKETMIEMATSVGATVCEVASVNEALHYAAGLLKEKKVSTLACPGLDKSDQDIILSLCKDTNLKLFDSSLRQHAGNLELSLTWAAYGVAETGTLMVESDSEDIRIATMMANIHIAMLPLSKVRNGMDDIAPELDKILKTDQSSYTAFITGPSRTADIERVLAIGVHGPVELHILLVQEIQQ